MRKTWKRALSLVLSAALVVTAGAFGTVQGDKSAKAADGIQPFEARFEAFNCLWNANWGQNTPTGDAWKVTVDEIGKDYTVKTVADNDAEWDGAFVVNTTLDYVPMDLKLVGKTVKVGDQVYDWSKAESYDDGGVQRISIWNAFVGTEVASHNPFQDKIKVKKGDVLEATFTVVEKTEKPLFVAEFNAFKGFWNPDNQGSASIASQGAWRVPVYEKTPNEYTVKVTAPEDWSFSGAFVVNTDLKELPKDFSLVGKQVKIGDEVYEWNKATAYVDGGTVRMSIWNEWGKDANGKWDPKANPLADDPTTISVKKGQVVEATFSVTEYKAPNGGNNGGATTKPTQKPQTPTVTEKVNGLAKGKTFSAGSLKYKVTKAATITSDNKKKTNGTVQVVGFSKSGKKKTSINVKNTVSRKSVKYNVKSIKSKAFQKSKKLKKATLGSKITSIPTSAFNADKKLTTVKATGVKKIGKSAFKGCVKLSKLTLGKKKISVSKGAFKGCKKTIKVSGGSKKVKKANIKKLKKSGYKKFK